MAGSLTIALKERLFLLRSVARYEKKKISKKAKKKIHQLACIVNTKFWTKLCWGHALSKWELKCHLWSVFVCATQLCRKTRDSCDPVSAETIRGVSSPDLIQSSLWILTLLCPLQKLLKLYKAATIHTAQAKYFSNIWYVPCQISLECSCSSASSSHNSTEWKMIPNGLCWAWIFKYTHTHTYTLGICSLTAVQHDSGHKITFLE